MLIEFLRAKWSIQVENDSRQGITREFYEIPIFRGLDIEKWESCRKIRAGIRRFWYLQFMGLAIFASEKSKSRKWKQWKMDVTAVDKDIRTTA